MLAYAATMPRGLEALILGAIVVVGLLVPVPGHRWMARHEPPSVPEPFAATGPEMTVTGPVDFDADVFRFFDWDAHMTHMDLMGPREWHRFVERLKADVFDTPQQPRPVVPEFQAAWLPDPWMRDETDEVKARRRLRGLPDPNVIKLPQRSAQGPETLGA